MLNGIFGTDGVRGRSNTYPMTPDVAMHLAQAAAQQFHRQGTPNRVVIGKDTRLSGYMLETAMVAGFTSVGMDVIQVGPLPTPAVAMLTRTVQASLGVMISASHNPYWDNGIKLFGPDGFKLSDKTELAIASRLRKPVELADAEQIGSAHRLDDARQLYADSIVRSFPGGLSLRGFKIVVDAANGAAYRCAAETLSTLGAEVIAIGCEPDGLNINAGFGSTHPKTCQEAVLAHGADLGIALDGDADRVIMIDENGALVDGDQLLALIADRMRDQGNLRTSTLVATIMSNMGLETYLTGRGLELARSKVGDRYVIELMRQKGCNLGGEQSGHIILSDNSTTGDGLLAATHILAGIVEAGKPASQTLNRFQPLPQVQRNIKLGAGALPISGSAVEEILADIRGQLGSHGRLVVRASGTEPLLRVMVEGESLSEITHLSDLLCSELEAALSPDWQDRSRSEDILERTLPDPVWAVGAGNDDSSRSPIPPMFN